MEAGSKLVSRKKKKEHEISLSPKVGLGVSLFTAQTHLSKGAAGL